MAVQIIGVDTASHAHKAGLIAGDMLVKIDTHSINDVLDYRFYSTEARLQLTYTRDGVSRTIAITKPQYDDLGLQFATYLMDKQRSCKNKCVFCFIDQLPKGMRPSLYFKDDDDRLSFLFGNFITLTNITAHEIERIITMHISPINISVHTTNPQLRVQMMQNPQAGTALEYIGRLTQSGIKVNTQLVLCPGINDGAELARSITDLLAYGENLQSIAVVPVGLTAHRQGLASLQAFTPSQAAAVIDTIQQFSTTMLKTRGTRVVYPADEFFLKAGRPIPPAPYYGDFDQLENGVGLMALLEDEFMYAIAFQQEAGHSTTALPRHVSIATGQAAYPLLRRLADTAQALHQGLRVDVYAIENQLLGPQITVAGLVCGRDIITQLAGKNLGQRLIITTAMLRQNEDTLLDDTTVPQLAQALGVPVTPIQPDGDSLLEAMCCPV